MPEVVLDLSNDFKRALEHFLKGLYDGLTIPVIKGILVRVIFLGNFEETFCLKVTGRGAQLP
jgi:hypothetical protein